MTAKELIALLQDMDPEAQVHFQYNYGDHSRTQVAPAVRVVTEGYVTHSTYHDMDRVADLDLDDEIGDKCREVVLLKS